MAMIRLTNKKGEPFFFKILPETVSWTYSMKIQSFDTFGGRVIQLLACNIEKLTMEGYIRPKHATEKAYNRAWESGHRDFDIKTQWAAMEEFERSVQAIMSYHETTGKPVRITFDSDENANAKEGVRVVPDANENGTHVFLTGYSDVRYEPDQAAAKYTLNFDVDTGSDEIKNAIASQADVLKSIPDGVGWVRNKYNTPKVDDWETVKDAIGKIVDDAGTHDASKPADFYSYLKQAFEGGSTDKGTTTGTESATVGSFSTVLDKIAKDVEYTAEQKKAAKAMKDVADATQTVLQGLGLIPKPKK